jgi:DNA-binding beta-propeller fold protein YncE
MNGSGFFTACACAAALVLGSCGNLQPSAAGAAQRPSASPVKAGLAKEGLIYVTNRDAEVTVYNLSTQAIVEVLTDFTLPMGECVDTGGNVYSTDSDAEEVFEYAHGGTKAIKTLDDSPDTPRTCAVDPTTGNLAVANDDSSSHQRNIAIWPEGSGQPTRYTNSTPDNFVGCAHDANGNLLTTNESAFAWLPQKKNGAERHPGRIRAAVV